MLSTKLKEQQRDDNDSLVSNVAPVISRKSYNGKKVIMAPSSFGGGCNSGLGVMMTALSLLIIRRKH